MKILVVSMLRLGDVLMAVPTIRGLKKKNPGVEIHVLMNRQFQGVTPMIPDVEHFWYFDRALVQDALVQADRSIFEAYDRVEGLVDRLNNQRFDQVINLTHNRLSGWLCGLIDCADKQGLAYNLNGQASFGSTWFRYLNDLAGPNSRDAFHLSDIFSFASGIKSKPAQLFETEAGQSEAQNLLQGSKNYILVQPLTSEDKKNWSFRSWVSALNQFQKFEPNVDVLVLGAEFERNPVEDLVSQLKTANVRARPAICSFEGVYSLLKNAKLLVTGDTSVKHLASSSPCPVIELSLGSSDFRKTGVYRAKNLILQSREYCSPCPHSVACTRETHACAERLPPEAVALSMLHLLHKNWLSLRQVAYEFADDVEIAMTHSSKAGYWLALPLTQKFDSWMLDRWVEKSAWKFLLEKEHQKKIGEYGTESLYIKESIEEAFAKLAPREWTDAIAATEERLQDLQFETEALRQLLYRTVRGLSHENTLETFLTELKTFCEENEGRLNLAAYILQQNEGSNRAPELNLQNIRKIQNFVEDICARTDIKMKLVRSLKSQTMEIQ